MPDENSIYEIKSVSPLGIEFSSDDYGVIDTEKAALDMIEECLGNDTVSVTLNGSDATQQMLRKFAEGYTRHFNGDVPLGMQQGAFMDAFDTAIRNYLHGEA